MSNRLVILGGGESGVGAAVLAKKKDLMCFFPIRGHTTRSKIPAP